ncbi:unnamed protein product, partial [Timema podura]|nr:unnamed protein product [Timema podura]
PGIAIVRKALRMPCMQIAQNAGVDAAVVVSKVEDLGTDHGYDALNNEYVNMIEKGIIDPTKVVRTALTDAAGVASLLTNCRGCGDRAPQGGIQYGWRRGYGWYGRHGRNGRHGWYGDVSALD